MGDERREKPYVLHFITPQKNASPFDANMAYDAGYDAVLPYTNVAQEEVTALVQDAIFSRGTRGVWRTGIFIGGRDMDVAMEMMNTAKKAMFPPFQVSLFADPSGAFTTGAALSAYVLSICRDRLDTPLKGKRVVVFGATGPVGGCASIMCAKEGAEVSLVAHSSFERTQKLAANYSKTYNVQLQALDGTDDTEKADIIRDAEILLCCAPPGTRVITTSMLAAAQQLLIAADVNAVPPSGIEGIDAMSNAEPIKGVEWALGLGALAIGSRKYNVQQKMFQMMLDSDTHVALDFMSAYEVARKLL